MNDIFETNGTILIIHLPEEVDHFVCDYIRKETDRIMGRIYIRTIHFDFQNTTFMDSSGIGLIMGRYRALGMRKNSVRGINVKNSIQRILRLSGLHKYISWEKGEE